MKFEVRIFGGFGGFTVLFWISNLRKSHKFCKSLVPVVLRFRVWFGSSGGSEVHYSVLELEPKIQLG